MKITLNADSSIVKASKRLCGLYDFEICDDGIVVNAKQSDRPGVVYKNGIGIIYYAKKHQFFRELVVFLENVKLKNDFEIYEDGFFKTLGVMIDASRCAVPTVDTICKMTDYLAVMGYNMIMLYTEDTVELKDYPYFGYMRGKYTTDELKAIDDYAYEYGIEVIPCLECYGHMNKYLIWSEASEIKDTAGVLLAREEKTFEFLDCLIRTVSGCFRSKRIHIGMDEAWDMGRGAFLDKHGYVAPIDIFTEYMNRLVTITQKYGLVPMMWSDMYFRASSRSGKAYYDEDTEISSDVAKLIPKDIQLVFWHYGEEPNCDEYMLKKHKNLNRDVIFAGGLWSWIGHFPEHNYAFETTKFSLSSCRKTGVDEMIATIWTNDNAECDLFANLFGLSFSAELCYNENSDCDHFKKRFEACTGGNYEAFYDMSQYHNVFDGKHQYKNFHDRFLGKPLFWQDIMEGLYDTHLFEKPISNHYLYFADKMSKYHGKWNELYQFASLVFKCLATKTEIAQKAVPAYKNHDKDTLRDIAKRALPDLEESIEKVHEAHRKMWFENYKIIGWANLDTRYAGVKARCQTARLIIESYLSGQNEKIEEFEEVRLEKPLSGFEQYSGIATVNLKI